MGTGKSQTLKIVHNFGFRSAGMSLRGMTGPAIRDKFAACYEGTAVVEEADAAWKDSDSNFERLISDRYQRDSAEASHKVKRGDKDWGIITKKYFGATALHRRISFIDPALDGRSVFVRSRPDHTRQYREYNEADEWNAEGRELIREVTFKLPAIEKPDRVAARVFCSYMPLLGVAKLCGDSDFENQTLDRLLQNTLELKEAQSSEPDGLRATGDCRGRFLVRFARLQQHKVQRLVEVDLEESPAPIAPRQIGPMARELGFSTKTSHGSTVVVPTPAALLRACQECEYSDEAVEELRQDLLGLGPKQEESHDEH